MEHSTLLMSANIHFIEAKLSLIQIPLDRYHHYLPTILRLLFPPGEVAAKGLASSSSHDYLPDDESWASKHAFLNVSITPIECSIVCDSRLAQNLFQPAIKASRSMSTSPPTQDFGSISDEEFVVVSVEGAGMEAGQRVLELTSPLALAGISLFFITTYFSDYILVPAKAKGQVVRALEDRGFAFERSSKTYVNPAAHHRHRSSCSSAGSNSPSTPPPKTVTELQARTFDNLRRHSIIPMVDDDLRLVQCCGSNENPDTFVNHELALQNGISRCLLHKPKFLSLTMTKEESASLLLEKRLLSNFDVYGMVDVLLGAKDDILIPITLDLRPLPFEATGIVCGVAGRLSDDRVMVRPIDMNYLSTASAGTVMVNEKDLVEAMEKLRIGADGSMQP